MLGVEADVVDIGNYADEVTIATNRNNYFGWDGYNTLQTQFNKQKVTIGNTGARVNINGDKVYINGYDAGTILGLMAGFGDIANLLDALQVQAGLMLAFRGRGL